MDMDQFLPHDGGQYGFSAASIDSLGAAEYTLATIVCDASGSVAAFSPALHDAIGAIFRACRQSPRADNLLIRLVQFDDGVDEIHGFKLLDDCDPKHYGKCLKIGGSTALFDAMENAIDAISRYGADLKHQHLSVNSLVFVLTDGEDNASALSATAVRHALEALRQKETLEAVTTVLVGVNVADRNIGGYLSQLKTDIGFDGYIELENANANTLAQLADFVSRSILAHSVALGSGNRPTLGPFRRP